MRPSATCWISAASRVGSAVKVHPLVGFEEEVDVAVELVMLVGGEGEGGAGGEVVPEGVHGGERNRGSGGGRGGTAPQSLK